LYNEASVETPELWDSGNFETGKQDYIHMLGGWQLLNSNRKEFWFLSDLTYISLHLAVDLYPLKYLCTTGGIA
jgi:hypothetical protein